LTVIVLPVEEDAAALELEAAELEALELDAVLLDDAALELEAAGVLPQPARTPTRSSAESRMHTHFFIFLFLLFYFGLLPGNPRIVSLIIARKA